MIKILLCCNIGMSTNLIVQKMYKSAEDKGIDISITEAGLNEVISENYDADVILLGPQLQYARKDLEKTYHVPLVSINIRDYGIMNGQAILEEALEALKNGNKKD